MPVSDSQLEEMLAAARDARGNAYAPYSEFAVGAAVLGGSGRVFTGCNVENASYGLTICAERVAIGKAVSEGERVIRAVAIVAGDSKPAPPCGACLQVIAEFSPAEEPAQIIIATPGLAYELFTLDDCLPRRFELHKR